MFRIVDIISKESRLDGRSPALRISPSVKTAGLFFIPPKAIMERDEPTIKGWHALKGTFLFGAAGQKELPPDMSERFDGGICSHESMGNGGYVASCDFDRLDQQ